MPTKRTSKKLDEATQTRMQELGSAWVFKRAIQDNKGWQRWEHIKRDRQRVFRINILY